MEDPTRLAPARVSPLREPSDRAERLDAEASATAHQGAELVAVIGLVWVAMPLWYWVTGTDPSTAQMIFRVATFTLGVALLVWSHRRSRAPG